jgi:hypothetical protein
MNAEQRRLEEARNAKTPWRKLGPYLSERPTTTSEQVLELGKRATVTEVEPAPSGKSASNRSASRKSGDAARRRER